MKVVLIKVIIGRRKKN